jgi:hypothetical protein
VKSVFKSKSYELYDLLTDRFARIELKLSHEAYQEYKKRKIKDFTESFTIDDYDKMLEEIINSLQAIGSSSKWHIEQGVISILAELSERNSNLYRDVIKRYLQKGDVLKLNPWVLVHHLIASCGAIAAFEVLSKAVFPSKNRWLFSYFKRII